MHDAPEGKRAPEGNKRRVATRSSSRILRRSKRRRRKCSTGALEVVQVTGIVEVEDPVVKAAIAEEVQVPVRQKRQKDSQEEINSLGHEAPSLQLLFACLAYTLICMSKHITGGKRLLF